MRFSLQSVLTWLRAGYPEGVPREDYIALFGVLQRHLTEAELTQVVAALAAAHPDRDEIGRDEIEAAIRQTVHGRASDADLRRVAAHLAGGGWPLGGMAPGSADGEVIPVHDAPDMATGTLDDIAAQAADLPDDPGADVPDHPSLEDRDGVHGSAGGDRDLPRHVVSASTRLTPARETPGAKGGPVGPIERFVNWVRAGYPQGVPEQDFVPLMALLRRRMSDEEVEDLGAELVRKGLIPADKIDVGVGMLKRTNELPSAQEMARVGARLRDAGWPVDVDTAEPEA